MVLLLQTGIAGERMIPEKEGDGAPFSEITAQRDLSSVGSASENDMCKIHDDASPDPAGSDTTLGVRQGKGELIAQDGSTSSSPAGHNWLFVIGIDKYTQWPQLRNSVHDSKAVRDILMERYMFDREYVMELYDEQATRQNIIERFEELARKVEANDNVLIYYAGHGEYNQTLKQGYWIPVDARHTIHCPISSKDSPADIYRSDKKPEHSYHQRRMLLWNVVSRGREIHFN